MVKVLSLKVSKRRTLEPQEFRSTSMMGVFFSQLRWNGVVMGGSWWVSRFWLASSLVSSMVGWAGGRESHERLFLQFNHNCSNDF